MYMTQMEYVHDTDGVRLVFILNIKDGKCTLWNLFILHHPKVRACHSTYHNSSGGSLGDQS